VAVTLEADELGVRSDLDRRVILDASHQVAGHGVCKACRADQHVHTPRRLREVHGRLSGGIATADHNDFLIYAELSLYERRP
jgi:hypothetical protein